MKTEGIKRAILGGCSIGSSIALLLGLDHPDLFDAVVLVGGNSQASDRFQARIEGYTSDLERYHLKHMHLLVEPKFSGSRLGAYLLSRYVERQPRLNGEAIAQVFRAANAMSTTDRLPQMKPPLLVINGETDHSRPGRELTASLVPGAVHRILPGTGHACCLEDPAGFDELVISFLEERGLLPSIRVRIVPMRVPECLVYPLASAPPDVEPDGGLRKAQVETQRGKDRQEATAS